MIAFWILYCLVISASYSGELRAYMINPSFTSPISTLQQVVDSGLPWGMVLYGEEEEEMMAASEDPVIKRIWNEKYVEVYSQTPKIDRVFDGTGVFIDWKSGLDPGTQFSKSIFGSSFGLKKQMEIPF